jgi:hypothetical protein
MAVRTEGIVRVHSMTESPRSATESPVSLTALTGTRKDSCMREVRKHMYAARGHIIASRWNLEGRNVALKSRIRATNNSSP